jgi:uncharacterized protein (DUF433 family)
MGKRVMDWRERITTDVSVCHGKACIKGTRIMVSILLDNLAAGLSRDDILASYPSLVPQDLDAAVLYAAELAKERVIPITSKVS